MSRLDSSAFAWFVLCVRAQTELATEKIMGPSGEGFATFLPVSREFKFANGPARARMQKTEVALPIMPRYVFLGMSGLTPGWERVFCYTGIFNRYKRRIVTGVLGVDGKPCRVRHEPLRLFMLRHSKGEFNALRFLFLQVTVHLLLILPRFSRGRCREATEGVMRTLP